MQCGQLQIIGADFCVDVTCVVAGRKSQCTFSRGNGSAGALEGSGWKGGPYVVVGSVVQVSMDKGGGGGGCRCGCGGD